MSEKPGPVTFGRRAMERGDFRSTQWAFADLGLER
jgi:hypothetical protein